MNDHIYCYPDSSILKNKLNIQNQTDLDDAEEKLSWLAYQGLLKNPIPGNFDFVHLKAVHSALFSKLYDWAGEIRLVDISKVNSFCPSQHINSFANDIFKNLRNNNYLKGLAKEEFITKFADVYSDLNALHPFREGNGRSLRLFMTFVATNAGHTIKFRDINKEKYMDACIVSVASGNINLLKEVFSEIIDTEISLPSYKEWKDSHKKIKSPNCNEIDDIEI